MATSSVHKNNIFVIFVYILCVFSIFNLGECTNCKGCVQLDSYCFDKIVSKFDAALVKFDVAYPYGDKHEEFSKVSESVRDVAELLVGEVGIKDYGEKDNTDLAERYGVSKDDFPVLMLFKPNAQPVIFNQDFKADVILNFIRTNSQVYVGLPGCLQDFDGLASEFSAATDTKQKRKILRDTEDLWDKTKGASNQKSAEVYVKTMRRAIENDDFVPGESKRIENIMKGKISQEKMSEMQLRLNILKSFSILKKKKDEL